MDTDTSAATITDGNPKRGDSMIDTMHMSFLHPPYPSWRPIRRLSFFIDALLLSTWKRRVAQFWAESTQHWTFSPSSHPFISSAITYSPHSAVLCITILALIIAQGEGKALTLSSCSSFLQSIIRRMTCSTKRAKHRLYLYTVPFVSLLIFFLLSSPSLYYCPLIPPFMNWIN